MLKNKIKLRKNKKGYISLYTILWLSVFVPFLIFIFVQFTLMVKQIVTYKNICDNAASSAVTYLDEDLIPDGIIKIRENDAKKAAKDIIISSLNLNENLTVNSNSIIPKDPTIVIEVYNDVPESGLTITKFNNKIKITKPSVIVTGEFPTYTRAKIKSIGVAQAQFDET